MVNISSFNRPTITVLGAGYVGLTGAALFAKSGYKVYIVEPNEDRLSVIKQGKSFFFEEGINPIIKQCINEGYLIPTNSYKESVPYSDIIFSSVGTPDNPDGSSNLTYIFSAAEEAAKYIRPGSIYVQKSTVPVGTGKKLINLFRSLKVSVSYVSNPEFLREGTAIYDTLYFDRVVVGSNDQDAVDKVLDLYRSLERCRDSIAQFANITTKSRNGQYIATTLNSAELIKITANAFLALKISFANSIALLADATDADINEVMDAVGADERIGRAFLNAGRGYGGGCFPKDVSGLIASCHEFGVDSSILSAAQSINKSMPSYIIDKVTSHLGNLTNKRIAVLGLAFKAGTSDVRKSPGIEIVNLLHEKGAIITAHDPQANKEAVKNAHHEITPLDSITEAIYGADAIIVATEWPEFRDYPISKIVSQMNGTLFVDAVNMFDKVSLTQNGLVYLGVGR